jgi:hypothetical protein
LLAKPTQLNINLSSDRFAMFNKERDISVFELPTGNAEFPMGDTGSDCAVGRQYPQIAIICSVSERALPHRFAPGDHKCIRRTFSSASLPLDAL